MALLLTSSLALSKCPNPILKGLWPKSKAMPPVLQLCLHGPGAPLCTVWWSTHIVVLPCPAYSWACAAWNGVLYIYQQWKLRKNFQKRWISRLCEEENAFILGSPFTIRPLLGSWWWCLVAWRCLVAEALRWKLPFLWQLGWCSLCHCRSTAAAFQECMIWGCLEVLKWLQEALARKVTLPLNGLLQCALSFTPPDLTA